MNRALCLAAVVGCAQLPAPLPPPDMSGAPAMVDRLKRGALFIDEENDAVLLATPLNGVHEYPCRWPAQVITDARGTVWAACRGEGVVRRITARADWHVGPEPRSLALDDARRRLYVGLATSNEVVMLDADTGALLRRVRTRAEPTSLALLGRHLVVASRKSAELLLFPRGLGAGVETVKLAPEKPDPRGGDTLGVEHLVQARDKLAIVATVATPGDPSQPTYYGGGFNASPLVQQLFVLGGDMRAEPLGTVPFPDVSSAVYLDQAWTGGLLMLASRGLAKAVVVELNVRPEHRLAPREGAFATWRALPDGLVGVADDGEQSWAFVDSTRTIWVAPSGAEVVAGELHQARISLMREDSKKVVATKGAVVTFNAPPSRLDAELAVGRRLFHTALDRRIAQSGISCAACHRDGRDDGRTWAGQGALRQTPMLAGRDIGHTAPYGWDGKYPTLEEYIEFTIRSRLRGAGLTEPDLAALARYVRVGLHGIDRRAPELSASAERGRALFDSEQLGCVSCHPADGAFTDGAPHDVGSVSDAEQAAWRRANRGGERLEVPTSLDTPSLLGLGVSAPYLHDGSATTLTDVFKRLGNHMGQVEQLSLQERESLVAYLAAL